MGKSLSCFHRDKGKEEEEEEENLNMVKSNQEASFPRVSIQRRCLSTGARPRSNRHLIPFQDLNHVQIDDRLGCFEYLNQDQIRTEHKDYLPNSKLDQIRTEHKGCFEYSNQDQIRTEHKDNLPNSNRDQIQTEHKDYLPNSNQGKIRTEHKGFLPNLNYDQIQTEHKGHLSNSNPDQIQTELKDYFRYSNRNQIRIESKTRANQSEEYYLATLLLATVDQLESSVDGQEDQMIQPLILEHYPELSTFDHLPLVYESSELYRSLYTGLLVYEIWSDLVRSYHGHMTPGLVTLSNKVNRDFYFRKHGSVVKSKESNQLVTLDFKAKLDHDLCKNRIQSWIVLVSGFLSNRDLCLGYVSHQQPGPQRHPRPPGDAKCDLKVTVEIHRKVFGELKSLFERETIFALRPLNYLQPVLRLIRTLNTIHAQRGKLFEKMLRPSHEICQWEDSVQEIWNSNTCNNGDFYNQHQRRAIQACLNMVQTKNSKQPIQFVLIQGPPGTGKTHTLLGILKNLILACRNNFSSSNPLRIMICTTTNGAIDEVGRRLAKAGEKFSEHLGREFRMIRIGVHTQVHPDLMPYFLDTVVEDYVERNHVLNSRAKWSKLRAECLCRADVILSTLTSCQHSTTDMFQQSTILYPISVLIVDEAGQCTEPELLMPLVFPSVTKVILLGDHKQLPATICSKFASEFGLGRSLFERFFNYFASQEEEEEEPDWRGKVRIDSAQLKSTITLSTQYRMHKSICRWPSKRFYGGTLETAEDCVQTVPNLTPYAVFGLPNSCEVDNEITMSRSNPLEAEFVVKLIQVIVSHLEVEELNNSNGLNETISQREQEKEVSIGVITFYRDQMTLIVEQLAKLHLSRRVEVNTVDGYQGQERDIIILSCVRGFDPTEPESSIGFVRSEQRMNVALTRARSALYVVLNPTTFATSTSWTSLIEDSIHRKRFHNVSCTNTFSVDKLHKLITSGQRCE